MVTCALFVCSGGRVRGTRGSAVPHQVDGPRGSQLQQVLHQVGRVVLRHPAHGAGHLRQDSVPGHDQRRGAAPGGPRLPHAVPARLPARALRDHAGVLAQGPREAAHLRDAAVEAGGLLHHGGQRVQGGVGLLRQAFPAEPLPPAPPAPPAALPPPPPHAAAAPAAAPAAPAAPPPPAAPGHAGPAPAAPRRPAPAAAAAPPAAAPGAAPAAGAAPRTAAAAGADLPADGLATATATVSSVRCLKLLLKDLWPRPSNKQILSTAINLLAFQ